MKSMLLSIVAFLFVSVNAKAQSCPCCSDMHEAFDFWVGTWEVTNAKGNKAGENIIMKVENGCVLKENWTSATPSYTGTSYSFYNSNTKQWEQLWIDNQGQSLHLKGHKVENQMILKSEETTDKNGNKFYNRVTWTSNDDGTVRQIWETVYPEKTNIAFDGLYKKKNN